MSDHWEDDRKILRRSSSAQAPRYTENESLMRPMSADQLRRPEAAAFAAEPVREPRHLRRAAPPREEAWEEPSPRHKPGNYAREYAPDAYASGYESGAPSPGYGPYASPYGGTSGGYGASPPMGWPPYYPPYGNPYANPNPYGYQPPYGGQPPMQGMQLHPQAYPQGYPAYPQGSAPPEAYQPMAHGMPAAPSQAMPVQAAPMQAVPPQEQPGQYAAQQQMAPGMPAAAPAPVQAMPVQPAPMQAVPPQEQPGQYAAQQQMAPGMPGTAPAPVQTAPAPLSPLQAADWNPPASEQPSEEVPLQAVLQSFPPASIPATPSQEAPQAPAAKDATSVEPIRPEEPSGTWAWDEWKSEKKAPAGERADASNERAHDIAWQSPRQPDDFLQLPSLNEPRKALKEKAVPMAQAIPVASAANAVAQAVPLARVMPSEAPQAMNIAPPYQPDAYSQGAGNTVREPLADLPQWASAPPESALMDDDGFAEDDFSAAYETPSRPAPAPVPMAMPMVAEEKRHSGFIMALLVVTLLVSLAVVYFTGVLDTTLTKLGIPVWSELSARLNPQEDPNIPQVFQNPAQGDAQSGNVVAPASASGTPKLTDLTVESPTATAPATMMFTILSNAAVQNIQFKNGQQELLQMTDVQSTPSGDGIVWKCGVEFAEPYQGAVYVYILSADGNWVNSGYSCQLSVQ